MTNFIADARAYTVFYRRALQPHRTISYALGVVVQLSVALLTLCAGFSS